MKYFIAKNEDRKTLTVLVMPISIGFVDYLYEKYNDERFFASGVLFGADYTKDIVPFAKDLASKLNVLGAEVLPPSEKFTVNDIVSLDLEDKYKLITKNTNKDGDWDKQFKLNLVSKSKQEDKKFLFISKGSIENLEAIPKEDGWKHNYAVELEISVGYNEDNMEKYMYTIFHRGISVGKKETNTYKTNDSAWSGFNFEEEESTEKETTEDLPNWM